MKAFGIVCFFSAIVTIMGDCTLRPTDANIGPNSIIINWYEIESYGDPWMSIFTKCIENNIESPKTGALQRTRSFRLKWFPFIQWKSTSTLTFRGTSWDLDSSTIFGQRTEKLSILQKGNVDDQIYMILKTCTAMFGGEKIWVYASVKEPSAGLLKVIDNALAAFKEPNLDLFRPITQNC